MKEIEWAIALTPKAKFSSIVFYYTMLRTIEQYLAKTVSILAHFVFFLFVVRFLLIEPGVVDGQSMEPNFWDNQFFVINKATPLVRQPKRFEVVQLFSPESEDHLVIKRVIGLPGETVSIKRNAVFVRNAAVQEEELREDYIYPNMIIRVEYGAPHEFLVPPHSYFVLGDNRMNSGDSRNFGPVHRERIVGLVMTKGFGQNPQSDTQ